MVDLTSAMVTTSIGMLGVIIGATISNYVNQRLAARSARRDLVFKKKVDYFDRVVGVIESNLKMYAIFIRRLGVHCTEPEANRVLKKLKKNRKKFEISTSALYLDVEEFSHDIKLYVAIEKQIFHLVNQFRESDSEDCMDHLRENLRKLNLVGNSIIRKMRYQLGSE